MTTVRTYSGVRVHILPPLLLLIRSLYDDTFTLLYTFRGPRFTLESFTIYDNKVLGIMSNNTCKLSTEFSWRITQGNETNFLNRRTNSVQLPICLKLKPTPPRYISDRNHVEERGSGRVSPVGEVTKVLGRYVQEEEIYSIFFLERKGMNSSLCYPPQLIVFCFRFRPFLQELSLRRNKVSLK